MAELYLTRHGQASFDGDNYDQLSPLGRQQCLWLGEYFRSRGIRFERIICGEMARHRQSADAICEGLGTALPYEIHAGFNEFDFEKLLNGFGNAHPAEAIRDRRDRKQVYRCLRRAMQAWSQGQLDDSAVPETWEAFEQRVALALDFAFSATTGNTLVCSSGGPISMALSRLMGFGAETLINTNLQMRNSSITHCLYTPGRACITGFNHVPHLDIPVRRSSISYS
ncbi:histidine phosphatase family protein [Marinobacterium nitratireducens]|uniref:Histidine phosphatase family protein n=1 Tax=Marinobacterium nitratireducens TaxID=518897 RepID=A0A917Z9R9_9GAMM|nr:histidine phosphatase family protein [Marinobacterium nitratireducens]GGO79111.1 histidine phosphatase family protein [Marinobacterium nitratireducens]